MKKETVDSLQRKGWKGADIAAAEQIISSRLFNLALTSPIFGLFISDKMNLEIGQFLYFKPSKLTPNWITPVSVEIARFH